MSSWRREIERRYQEALPGEKLSRRRRKALRKRLQREMRDEGWGRSVSRGPLYGD